MWLINTRTLQIEERREDNPGRWKYAILSHTWAGGEEINFREYRMLDFHLRRERDRELRFSGQAELDQVSRKSGFHKIYRTCELARAYDIEYAWVDTCCIDKSSSSELSEAINSMFRWYQEAEVCFVYLSDLPAGEGTAKRSDLAGRRWFYRGWTLQELIAPTNVKFYDKAWNLRGNKESLESILFEITRIPPKALRDSSALQDYPVGQRMSWASERHTERVEDLAYCLFGIFDVNLPLIYGERTKAFIRLQEAIAQESNDLSLFAWTSNDASTYRGAFALSPTEFARCDQLRNIDSPLYPAVLFSLSNNALHMSASLLQGQLQGREEKDYLLNLQCIDESMQQSDGTQSIIFIRLVKTAQGFVRHLSTSALTLSRSSIQSPRVTHSINVPKHITSSQSQRIALQQRLRVSLVINNLTPLSIGVHEHFPSHLWDAFNDSFITNAHESFVAIFSLQLRRRYSWGGAKFSPDAYLITCLIKDRKEDWIWAMVVPSDNDLVSKMRSDYEKDHDPHWLSEIRKMALDHLRERTRQGYERNRSKEIKVEVNSTTSIKVSTTSNIDNPGTVVLNVVST